VEPKTYQRSDVQQRDSEKRLEWFKQAKYGMFIHWGLYAVPAGIWQGRDIKRNYTEWIQPAESIPYSEYSQLAKEFNPTEFNPIARPGTPSTVK
jgi:alpha-L-fucosidase